LTPRYPESFKIFRAPIHCQLQPAKVAATGQVQVPAIASDLGKVENHSVIR